VSEPSARDLQALAEMRLSASYYLAGYSVECGLKAIIALSFRAQVIPNRKLVNQIYSHQLLELINLAGLKTKLLERTKASEHFNANWAVVSDWTEETRYQTTDPFMAVAMFQAVSDQQAGVLPWLKTHW